MKNKITVQYKDIPGYEGKYQVSTLGEVIRLSDRGEVKQKRLKITCYEPRGKPYVTLCENGKGKKFTVCNLIASAFLKKPEGEWYVKYRTTDKLDNRPSNLFYEKKGQYNVYRLTHIQELFIEWLINGGGVKHKGTIRDKFDYWLSNIK